MKKIDSVIILIILLFFGFEILYNSKGVLSSVSLSLDVFKNNVFPSLFPFFVLSNLLLKYGCAEMFGSIFKGLMNKLFGINGRCSFIFFISIISGNPSNAKYARELYLNGDIDKYDVFKILCFSSFVSPLFIIGFVGSLLGKRIAILVLICHYLSNIIIGFFLRNFHKSTCEKSNYMFVLDEVKKKRGNAGFGIILTNCIVDSINSLLLILGVITVCYVFTTIVNDVFGFKNISRDIIDGLIEMTQGIKYLGMENINLKIKSTLIVFLLSFGGLSIHLQIMSILSDVEFKYLPFLLSRIISSIVSSCFLYFLFDIIV